MQGVPDEDGREQDGPPRRHTPAGTSSANGMNATANGGGYR